MSININHLTNTISSAGTISIPGFAPAATVVRSARTANTILAVADQGTLIDITSGTFSQTFTAAATLASGWFCYIRNSGTGDITLDPNASELIDGLTSYVMYGGETRLVQCTGTAFTSVVLSTFSISATASFGFTKPPGYRLLHVIAIGGAGGGGSGGRFAAAAERNGGAGGSSSNWNASYFDPADLEATVSISIGAGGAGGAGQGTDNTGGNAGGVGGDTVFASLFRASGGGGGNGGTATTGGGPGPGANQTWAMMYWSGSSGGAGSDGANSGTAGTASTTSPAGGGGGGGGGTSAGNVAIAGGAGGNGGSGGLSGGAAGVPGVNGTAGPYGRAGAGGGGGSGSGTTASVGVAGGAGGLPGGGGGGGSGSTNANVSGAGGAGGGGRMHIAGVL